MEEILKNKKLVIIVLTVLVFLLGLCCTSSYALSRLAKNSKSLNDTKTEKPEKVFQENDDLEKMEKEAASQYTQCDDSEVVLLDNSGLKTRCPEWFSFNGVGNVPPNSKLIKTDTVGFIESRYVKDSFYHIPGIGIKVIPDVLTNSEDLYQWFKDTEGEVTSDGLSTECLPMEGGGEGCQPHTGEHSYKEFRDLNMITYRSTAFSGSSAISVKALQNNRGSYDVIEIYNSNSGRSDDLSIERAKVAVDFIIENLHY